MRQRVRRPVWRAVLPVVNLLAWALFLAVREPAVDYLRIQEAARIGKRFEMSDVDPVTTLAERPLNTWSRWHGGESSWVKLLEVPNLVPLVVTVTVVGIATVPFWEKLSVYSVSWARAAVFLFLSSLQWYLVGRRLESRGGRIVESHA